MFSGILVLFDERCDQPTLDVMNRKPNSGRRVQGEGYMGTEGEGVGTAFSEYR